MVGDRAARQAGADRLERPAAPPGVATEAAKAGLRYGFEQVGLEHIVAIVHVDNGASQRVAQKLGMGFVDQARYFGIDCHRYAIEPSLASGSAGRGC
jgi:ribosomal-protein-alanine N-acetyltransferase